MTVSRTVPVLSVMEMKADRMEITREGRVSVAWLGVREIAIVSAVHRFGCLLENSTWHRLASLAASIRCSADISARFTPHLRNACRVRSPAPGFQSYVPLEAIFYL